MTLARIEVEDLLYREAALLDAWKLEAWLALFTQDCVYEVPAPDIPLSDPATTFSLVHDHRAMLEQRVIRMLKPTAHAESPHSRTRRIIGNVRIVDETAEHADVEANFIVFRVRGSNESLYIGRYEYRLRKSDLKIQRKKVVLEHENLHTQGKVSIIL